MVGGAFINIQKVVHDHVNMQDYGNSAYIVYCTAASNTPYQQRQSLYLTPAIYQVSVAAIFNDFYVKYIHFMQTYSTADDYCITPDVTTTSMHDEK